MGMLTDRNEIVAVIRNLKNNKAVYHDEVSAEFIKMVGKEMVDLLLLLVDLWFKTTIPPIMHKLGFVTYILKLGKNLKKFCHTAVLL